MTEFKVEAKGHLKFESREDPGEDFTIWIEAGDTIIIKRQKK